MLGSPGGAMMGFSGQQVAVMPGPAAPLMQIRDRLPAGAAFAPPYASASTESASGAAEPRASAMATERDVDDELRRHAAAVESLLEGSAASGQLGAGGSESLRQLLRSIASGSTGVSADGMALTGQVPSGLTAVPTTEAAAASSAAPAAAHAAEYEFVAEAESNPFLGGAAREVAGLGDADGVPAQGLGAEGALEMGARLLREGRLRRAMLCLEAAVRQEADLSEAWRLLGSCHAESEDDARAILCLERAVETDPFNLRALLDLGCSLVNELQEERAARMLTEWVRNNPRFADIDVDAAGTAESEDLYSDGSELDGVTRLMLRVSAAAPEDAEVANVLGLLYNISREWDAAAAAFRVASEGRAAAASDSGVAQYVVLNRLAATLANGGRAGEAIPVYRKVLALRPGYTRAMYNLGVSLDQAGQHKEAVEWLVRALQRNPDAQHAWRRLRIALFSLDGEQRLQEAEGAAEAGGDDGDVGWRDRLIGHAYDMDVDALARELGVEAAD